MQRLSLPVPSAEELAHSQTLQNLIMHQIQASPTHSMSFYDYMNQALYAPQLGYYVAGKTCIGTQGDFITAPELSDLFSMGIAQHCLAFLHSEPNSTVLELGAGSGKMAAALLSYWESQDALPQHYYLLEPSPSLKAQQLATLQARLPHLMDRITWLERLPDQSFQGIILGNEVLDAMPIELIRYEQGQYQQVHVTEHNHQLAFTTRTAPQHLQALIADLSLPSIAGYTTELNPQLNAWVNTLGALLTKGFLLLIDYGYSQAEYYHPDRTQGTLQCFYRHHVHDNPLLYSGLQDITASVDFDALTQAAVKAGFHSTDWTSQAHFLIQNGLEQHFQQLVFSNPELSYSLAQQVRILTLPAEMGERFKVFRADKG
ncbi:MAG: SAM-dependent methyltransferase [Thiofilum sp.]|uniref:class I SAM-dependent methyltransferase n=1 Tax=Thiofilum sp. TaxID=2212733 RepID=UPI0025FD632E|nr:SAM-dependent methyltransferase [Thiofilum sp.]MBK8453099.1 SAM-dependent methyltransferase [Thiofilum sp.]